MVPCGIPDIIEIVMLAAGTDAALATNRSGVTTILKHGERIFKLHHA